MTIINNQDRFKQVLVQYKYNCIPKSKKFIFYFVLKQLVKQKELDNVSVSNHQK